MRKPEAGGRGMHPLPLTFIVDAIGMMMEHRLLGVFRNIGLEIGRPAPPHLHQLDHDLADPGMRGRDVRTMPDDAKTRDAEHFLEACSRALHVADDIAMLIHVGERELVHRVTLPGGYP